MILHQGTLLIVFSLLIFG